MRFPSRTSRIAPGAPAATSASTSFCSPAALVFVAVLGVAIADAAIAAADDQAREHCSPDRKLPASARRSVFGVVSWSSCLRSVGPEQCRARRCADRERDDHEREPAEDRRLAALRAQRTILEARLFRPIAGRSAGRSCTTGLSGSSCITRVFIAAPLGVRAWLHARSSDRVSEDGKLVLRGPVFSRSRPAGCVRRAGRARRRERGAIPSQSTEGRACRRSSKRAVRRRGA